MAISAITEICPTADTAECLALAGIPLIADDSSALKQDLKGCVAWKPVNIEIPIQGKDTPDAQILCGCNQ